MLARQETPWVRTPLRVEMPRPSLGCFRVMPGVGRGLLGLGSTASENHDWGQLRVSWRRWLCWNDRRPLGLGLHCEWKYQGQVWAASGCWESGAVSWVWAPLRVQATGANFGISGDVGFAGTGDPSGLDSTASGNGEATFGLLPDVGDRARSPGFGFHCEWK